MEIRPLPLLVLLACAAPGCNRDDGDSSSSGSTGGTSGSTGGFWAVGQTGAMVRMTPAGEASAYPEPFGVDLWAIACVGAHEAWVVGAGGTVLRTDDGGATWRSVDVGRTEDLYAVAVDEARGTVYVGGDGLLLAAEAGGAFVPVPGAEPGVVTALAAAEAGGTVYATTADGGVLRVAGGVVDRVFDAGAALYGVATADAGDLVVVVGAGGAAFLSLDAGAAFEPVPTGLAMDLRAVATAGDGGAFVAVGDGGLWVRYDGIEVEGRAIFDPVSDLRAVHLRVDGVGQVAGHDGVVHVTFDGGRTWSTTVVEPGLRFEGIDDFAPTPHA